MTFEQWLEKQHPERTLIRHEVVAGWLKEAWDAAAEQAYKNGYEDGYQAADDEAFEKPKPPKPPENYTLPGAM